MVAQKSFATHSKSLGVVGIVEVIGNRLKCGVTWLSSTQQCTYQRVCTRACVQVCALLRCAAPLRCAAVCVCVHVCLCTCAGARAPKIQE